jgi:hypothetical protein
MNRANHGAGSSHTLAGNTEPTVVRSQRSKAEGVGVPLCILVIEDSEEDATIILRELKGGGYDVDFERVDSPEALQISLATRKSDL